MSKKPNAALLAVATTCGAVNRGYWALVCKEYRTKAHVLLSIGDAEKALSEAKAKAPVAPSSKWTASLADAENLLNEARKIVEKNSECSRFKFVRTYRLLQADDFARDSFNISHFIDFFLREANSLSVRC